MLLTDKIIINTTNNTKGYYINLGYQINDDNSLCIFIKDLPKKSGIEIDVKCDNCDKIRKIQYRNYLKSKEVYDKYYCNKCCHKKSEKTYIKKNNIKCIFLDDNFIKNTKLRHEIKRNSLKDEKNKNKIEYNNKKIEYNNKRLEEKRLNFIKKAVIIHENKYDYTLVKYKTNKIKVEIICKVCGSHFFQSPSNHVNHKQNCSFCDGKYKIEDNSFNEYCKEIRKETYKYKKELFENWDGYDFYDNEYIKCNFILKSNDDKYPNIDHKISIKFGFDNNILVEKIGNIDNLCITKRILNIKKGRKNYV